jgi:hypothetical protein
VLQVVLSLAVATDYRTKDAVHKAARIITTEVLGQLNGFINHRLDGRLLYRVDEQFVQGDAQDGFINPGHLGYRPVRRSFFNDPIEVGAMLPDPKDDLVQEALALGGQLLINSTPINDLINGVIGSVNFKKRLEGGDADAVT